MLADFGSKLLHGMLRQRLLPSFTSFRLSTQAGGVPKISDDMLQLMVQAQALNAKCAQRSFGSVFIYIYIQQAFYTAVRPFIVSGSCSDAQIAELFVRNGWDPEFFHDFRAMMEQGPALAQARVSQHTQAQVSAMLSNTWFRLRHFPGSLTATRYGTRPGDSIADILYAFLQTRFCTKLQQKIEEAQFVRPQTEMQWFALGDWSLMNSRPCFPARLVGLMTLLCC